jgi:hypothetical protein
LLGLATFRGHVAPVYDLSLLIGKSARSRGRCLVLVRGAAPVAFAFDAFEGQFAVAPDAWVLGVEASADTSAMTTAAVAVGGALRPVLRLVALIETIQQRVQGARKESIA